MKIKLNIIKTNRGYKVQDDMCYFCSKEYLRLIGDVTGNVTFIFKKIKGRATEYNNPFRIRYKSLQIHYYDKWIYCKMLSHLSRVIDINEIIKWAGTSTLSLEVEYED